MLQEGSGGVAEPKFIRGVHFSTGEQVKPQNCFILEVDGEKHGNRVLKRSSSTSVVAEPSVVDKLPTGSTLLRNQIFRNLGYSFYVVSHAMWTAMGKDLGESGRIEWLRKLVQKKLKLALGGTTSENKRTREQDGETKSVVDDGNPVGKKRKKETKISDETVA
ncbi:unnamed protein product [Amoebophrya sp. A25]|nr:unnamed protein product [Amoebophrya sp. A25]|eukprot:GSA25T00022202001.1